MTMRPLLRAALFALPLAAAACGRGTRASSHPPPASATPVSAPPRVPADTAYRMNRQIQVCVVQNGELGLVVATYIGATGDTSFGPEPSIIPRPYAAPKRWYVENEPIVIEGSQYIKYAPPRSFRPGELQRVGEYDGVPVFAESASPARPPDVVYVPVRGCEFQSYHLGPSIHGVRGG